MATDVLATDADFARVRAAWGLDQPRHIQYATYVGNIFRGNFGESIKGVSINGVSINGESIKWKGQDALTLMISGDGTR